MACVGLCTVARAQEPAIDSSRPLAAVIDDYVREGLHSNLALRAQSLEVERSVAALDTDTRKQFDQVYEAILGLMGAGPRSPS